MTDEKYLFRQTEFERKNIARGAYKKKNGVRSKKCTLPSDKMSKKERDAMNGEVKRYSMNKPMNWKEFIRMPNDLQNEYLIMLTDEVGASRKDVADMFGVKDQRLSDYLHDHHKGIYYFRGKNNDHDKFLKWCCGDNDQKREDEKAEVQAEKTEKKAEKETVVIQAKDIIKSGRLEFCGSAKEVFEKMMMVLDGNTKYKISVDFQKMDLIDFLAS